MRIETAKTSYEAKSRYCVSSNGFWLYIWLTKLKADVSKIDAEDCDYEID